MLYACNVSVMGTSNFRTLLMSHSYFGILIFFSYTCVLSHDARTITENKMRKVVFCFITQCSGLFLLPIAYYLLPAYLFFSWLLLLPSRLLCSLRIPVSLITSPSTVLFLFLLRFVHA